MYMYIYIWYIKYIHMIYRVSLTWFWPFPAQASLTQVLAKVVWVAQDLIIQWYITYTHLIYIPNFLWLQASLTQVMAKVVGVAQDQIIIKSKTARSSRRRSLLATGTDVTFQVCMYVCMYACMRLNLISVSVTNEFVRVYICMYVCMNAHSWEGTQHAPAEGASLLLAHMWLFRYVCMYIRMYVYVCKLPMCLCVHIHVCMYAWKLIVEKARSTCSRSLLATGTDVTVQVCMYVCMCF
jgi:hypothetical protein